VSPRLVDVCASPTVAAEGGSHGITCNAIAPLARTRMSAGFLAARDDAAEPAALAPLVVYLASPGSVAVTGEVFRVRDGRIALARQVTTAGVAPAVACWTVAEIAARMDEIRGRPA
jgi:hypothetical protein